jgi:D-alanyl-D-alanine carboxypeptidase/D-alanyl-D-alanine-endopeptidase (penicillin-binding protein 4)
MEIVEGILEPSQNWMAEQLVRSLGATDSTRAGWSDGLAAVREYLVSRVGVDSLDVSLRDGSGLSAYNLVTPRAVVAILLHAARQPWGPAYRTGMAEPGEEGSTLASRLDGLEGRLFAKTGTISNVNSLSGYLVTDQGREVVFSILTNGSGLPASLVRDSMDRLVRTLASSSY